MSASGVVRQRTAGPVAAPERFPFDTSFQQSLLRLLCEDDAFARAATPHLKPTFFEGDVLQWAYAFCLRHREQYGTMPSLRVLLAQTRSLDPRTRPLYTAVVEQVVMAPIKDAQWLRDQVLEFVRRNIFVRAFNEGRDYYNSGKIDQAYDFMMREMEKLTRTTWLPVDRSDFFNELHLREQQRSTYNPNANAITTGYGWLDHILGGGLSLGEMGIWIAYPKIGKTTKLIQHGVACTRYAYRRCLHMVFEGSRAQTEARYDTAFSQQLYQEVKHGGIRDSEVYARLYREYQLLKGLLIVRGFTEKWTYTFEDVQGELDELKVQGWTPSEIIIDYIDLVSGRNTPYRSEHEKQRDAARDCKSLANRGYAVWTATQAQRPKDEKVEETPHIVMSRQIADCYDKVRVADFIGSLNQTKWEKEHLIMRAYAELYRDNAANQEKVLRADYPHMTIREEAGLVTQTPSAQTTSTPQLGMPTQMKAPFA